MTQRLQNLFNLEAYQTPVARQRARNLYWLIILVVVLTFITLLDSAESVLKGDNSEAIYVFIVLLASQSLAWWVNRRGQREIAAWLIPSSIVVLALGYVALVRDSQILSVIPSTALWFALLVTSLILDKRSIAIFTLLTLAGLGAAFAAGMTVGEPGELIFNAITFTTLTAAVGGIAWLNAQAVDLIFTETRLEEARRSLVLQKTTATVAQQLTTQLDLETLLKQTVEVIRDQFEDIYHAQVFLIERNGRVARLRASTGDVGQALLAKKHSLEVGSVSVIGQVTATNHPVLVSDTSADPVHKVNELLPNTLTELAIPLRSPQGIIGALDVQSTKRHAFSPADVEILQALSDQIAIAVENARLFAAAQAEAQRAKAIAEASQITSQLSVDFDKGLARLFETVTAPGHYTHWWFGVVQPDGKNLRCVTSHKSLVTGMLIPYEIDLEHDKNSLVDTFRAKRAIIINDLKASSSFREVTFETGAMFGKHIASPIFESDTRKVVGVLLVGRDLSAPDLDTRDLELVSAVTSQLSIALQNRRLFFQVEQEQKRLLAALNTMPVSVVMVDKLGKVMLANEQAQTLLGDSIKPGASMDDAHPIYRTGTDELYPSDELPLHLALSKRSVHSAEDLAIHQPTGIQVDVLSKAAPLMDENGLSAVISVYQDITELRELERALQESLSETTKLYEASRAISHASDVPTIAEAVVNQLLILSPDQVYMTLRDADDPDRPNDIQLILSWPHEKPARIQDLGLPTPILMPNARLSTVNMTFATHNLGAFAGLTEQEVMLLRNRGIHAMAVLPLEARGEVFGAIIALFKEERLFAPEERRFLLTLADQSAVALDAILSFQSTQNTLKSISRMYQASRAISSESDIEDAIQVIKDQIMILDPDRIDISLARDQGGADSLENMLTWSVDGDESNIVLLHEEDTLFEMLSREDFFIEDTYRSQEPMAAPFRQQQSPYRAIASLPFRAGGQPTGRLTVGFKMPRGFSRDDRQYLQMVADSTAYVIENDMLFRQTQDSLEETGILYQAIRAFANAEDKEGILQAIIDYAADPAVDKAMLCLLLTEGWDSPNALMEVVVSWVRGDSVDLTGMRFTSEQFPSWEQISTTEILAVDDVMEDPTLDDTARMGYRALDIGSFVIVPLAMAGKAIGAILLGASDPRRHTEREVRIYQSLADQAAITMENIRLYEEADRRARQLSTSARVSQAASSILKIDELLPEMVDLIKDAFGYDQVQVFLLSETGDRALLKASTGEAGRQLLAINHFLEVGSRSVIGTVTATGKPSIALDTADARVIHKPNPYLPNTRSEMAIPLIAKGEILGALDVQSNQPGAFTEGDVRVLTILADQLAVAIQNASLFELAQQRSEEMSFLFTVAAESTTAEDLGTVLQRVSELLLYQINATLVVPYLYREAEKVLVVGALASIVNPNLVKIPPSVPLNNYQDVITAVVANKMPFIINDYDLADYRPQRSSAMKSGLYAPLIVGNRLIGVLALESDKRYQFDDNSLNLLQALTGSLSAVIQSKQLLQEIQKANERLLEIDKLKTNFLAAMSHELRTPLNSIIGFSRVILKGIDGPVTDMQRQDLQTIHDSGKHLLGLVNDILDQAKIEAGKMELAKEYFDLHEVVKGVMSSAVGLTKEKPIRLYTEMNAELPQAFGDEFRTRQILLNLVSNAAKFTEEGSITTAVHLVENNGVPYLQISVTDTGIGIRTEDFDKLFESFQQVDNSTTRSAEGTGLGLPLARSLTELQGGSIRVESEYGVGSTFSFTVPTQPAVVETEDEQERMGPPTNGRNPITTPKPPKTIVILDDNVDMMNLYRRHLNKEHYDVIGTTHVKDAKDKLMILRSNAIIVNVDMDEGKGWAYLEELVQMNLPRPVPVIASSIYADQARSVDLGAVAHLVRPFEPEALIETIRQFEKAAST